MDDFLKYYERELTFTREMLAEFARKYPKVAARLQLEPDKCEDPQMERLIEAFAFECARLHMKIDDHFPEIAEPLLNLVFPHFIKPIPSMAVVKFQPANKTIPPSGYEIEKNRELFSEPINGTDCRFSTIYPVTLWPVEITSAGLREPRKMVKDARRAIVIELKTFNSLGIDQIGWETLRFCIPGSGGHAFHLYSSILNNTCHMEYVASDPYGKTCSAEISPDLIRPVGFEPDEALIPALRKEFPGFLLLFEYFCFPEKFLFIDFGGLGKIRHKGMDRLELWIYLNKVVTPDTTIDKDTFVIHCAPVINLFDHTSESMDIEPGKIEYRLGTGGGPAAIEIYDVGKVIGTTADGLDTEFKPLFSGMSNSLGDENRENVFWQAIRRPAGGKGDNGTDVFLSFSDREMKPASPGVEQLVVKSRCTNRDLPARLRFGDRGGGLTMQGAVPVSRIDLAVKPTATRRPALGGVLQWQVLSMLKPNYLPLMRGQEEAFRAILRLYNLDDSPFAGQMISGISTIESRHVTRRIGQAFLRGVEITIGFDGDSYEESGLFLFGSVLERFFSQYVSSGSFTQLVAKTLPGGHVYKVWPPRRGVRPLL